jgi:hypothetical protein
MAKENKELKPFIPRTIWDKVYVNPEDRHLNPVQATMWKAVYKNDLEGYKAAISEGANIWDRDMKGLSSRDVAKRLGHNQIADYFDSIDSFYLSYE